MTRRALGRRPLILPAFGIVWMVVVASGLSVLWHYQTAAGIAGVPPAHWPRASRIVPANDRPTLVVAVHPHCPCSRASLEELDRLMARVRDRVSAHVLFVKPGMLADDWVHTDLWRRAAAIRGVAVMADVNGREAERFAAATSGQTMLYGPDGRLLFSGGITSSRGHAGDNAGRSAIVALVTARSATTRSTPVFGCALLGTHAPDARDVDPAAEARHVL
jgi:hypothetical protein